MTGNVKIINYMKFPFEYQISISYDSLCWETSQFIIITQLLSIVQESLKDLTKAKQQQKL